MVPVSDFSLRSVLFPSIVFLRALCLLTCFSSPVMLSRLSPLAPLSPSLNSPLFGVNEPKFAPINWILAFFGGHFSPVVGFFEDVNLVAIFDVNHTYSTFFVTPERFYEAIHTFDVTSGKARGLVVTECV